MTTPLVLTAASADFQAARRLHSLPTGHRALGLHGHGFQATVYAELPAGWAEFAGSEVQSLRQRLQQCLRPLDYADLNGLMAEPGDSEIALWIAESLAVPGLQRVALHSTPTQGVDLIPGAPLQTWRRYRFQAAHRLPRVALGHKCGRMHGHAFEAIVHASGVSADRIDALWAPLHMQLNYQCLNEIEGMDNPTSELLSSWIWARLQTDLPGLCGVTVFETGSCGAHFDGSDYRIWKEFTLDSAVRLRHAPQGSALRNLHGHTFTLRLHLQAPVDEVLGWTMDFGDVKQLFSPLFEELDHQPLHEKPELADGDTAAIASWILAQARPSLPSLVRVDLYEARGCGSLVGAAAAVAAGLAMPV